MRLKIATGIVGLIISAPIAHAETATVCSQKVDYTPPTQQDMLSAEQSALWGIWEGDVAFSLTARFCVGFVIGRINENGEPDLIYAWDSARPGINNVAKMGSNRWRGGKYQNGDLLLKGKKNSFQLTKTREGLLEGFFINSENHRYEAKLMRRKGI